MAPRYTIRQVVGTYRRKAFGTRHPDGAAHRPPYPADAIVAFYGTLELAEEQPVRGRFESERLLRVLLEGPDRRGARFARQVPFLIAQDDLVRDPDGTLAVEGWSELQEGDVTIADRVSRFRSRKRPTANGAANGTGNGGRNAQETLGLTPPVTLDPRATEEGGTEEGDGRGHTVRARDSATVTDEQPEMPVLQWLATHQATVMPTGGLHQKVVTLVDRHGAKAVQSAMARLGDGLTARQYVLGADNGLNPIPTGRMSNGRPRAKGEEPGGAKARYAGLVQRDEAAADPDFGSAPKADGAP